MQYLGNFMWEKENGKIARVDEKAFVGFSGKVVKTVPKDDTYIVRIPEGKADFIREGKENNNCVGTFNYYELMLGKQIFVVFIREKVNPDKAFITCEISPRGKILQYLGRSNVEVPAADAFKKKYQAFLKENFNH